MSKIFEFNKGQSGTLIDSVSKTAGTLTAGNGGFKKTEKGQAMLFDKTTTKIVYGTNLVPTGDVTLEFWYYCDSNASESNLWLFGNDKFYIRTSTQGRWVTTRDAAAFDVSPDNLLIFNKWTHFVVKIVGTTLYLYNNSVLVDTGTIGAYTSSANPYIIGAISPFGNNNWRGYIGKATVYNTALTQSEINELYKEFFNSSPTEKDIRGFEYPKPTESKETGKVAHYVFSPETVSNGTLLDVSGKGNHGTISGALLTKEGMKFDGTSSITTPSVTLGTVYTLAYRGKFTSTANQVLITDNSYHHRLTSNTAFTIYTGTSAINLIIPDIAGKEVDIVFVRNGTDIRVYVNGVLASTGTNPDNNSFKFNRLFGLTSSQRFDGTMIDNKFYNYAFTPQQAKDYHNSFVKPTLIETFDSEGADGVVKTPKGWIPGTGSYKVSENLVEPETVTNGTFSIDSGWTKGSSWSIANGKASCDCTAVSSLSQADLLTAGQSYVLKFDILDGNCDRLGLTNTGISTTGYAIGSHELKFTASTTGSLIFYGYNGDTPFSIDNISLRKTPTYDGLPTGTKYLECTSNGTIIISADLDSFTDKGYIYIDRYNGSSWTRYESTVSDLSTNESWFDYSNKKITLTGTTGDRFANLKIYNGVKQ